MARPYNELLNNPEKTIALVVAAARVLVAGRGATGALKQVMNSLAPPILQQVIDLLPAPIYVTDEVGIVTHFNSACINFAGRTPVAGQDRWCVTWRLYTDSGIYLPHHECPMAVAIRDKRPVRGAVAIAERPDQTRVPFTPYPTPILSRSGIVVGAVNMLIDISDRRPIHTLH